MRWLVLPLLILFFCTSVYAQPQIKIGGNLEETELGEIEDFARDNYDIDLKGLIGNIIDGDGDVDLWKGLTDVFFNELKSNSSFVRSILLICILNGLIATAMEGFADRGVVQTAYFAAFTAVAGMLVTGYKICADVLTEGAAESVELLSASTPLILSLVSIGGNGTAAAGFSVVLGFAAGIVNSLIGTLIVPQFIFAVMLGVINCLWDRGMTGRLADLFAFLAMWELKICAFIFAACLALGRLVGGAITSTAGKGVKLAIGAVPVVGDLFENSIDTVLAFVGALKGGAAVALIIIISLGAAGRLIKLCAVMLLYKLTAALTEPMGNKKITEMIDVTAEGIKLLIGAYFTLVITFITAVVVMLGSLG